MSKKGSVNDTQEKRQPDWDDCRIWIGFPDDIPIGISTMTYWLYYFLVVIFAIAVTLSMDDAYDNLGQRCIEANGQPLSIYRAGIRVGTICLDKKAVIYLNQ